MRCGGCCGGVWTKWRAECVSSPMVSPLRKVTHWEAYSSPSPVLYSRTPSPRSARMTILATCDKCGCRYTLKDELAGRKGKCKQCQAVFVIPQPAAPPKQVATTGAGDPVYRYSDEDAPNKFEFAIGDS